MISERVRYPVCRNKTRLQIRVDRELKNFLLYFPKCKQGSLIDAK
ncbi:MAG: cysteine-rich KTR domain-containing protein [Massilioclostridium sp.]|nr:cysteine-rich KTR domain-containing protein [Massilioclostridium sp.]